jgi:hypothetical protein
MQVGIDSFAAAIETIGTRVAPAVRAVLADEPGAPELRTGA